MPPLEKGLLETLQVSPPPCTMLLTSSMPPSRSSSSTSTTTNTTTTSSATTISTASSSIPSTIEKMATSTALLSRQFNSSSTPGPTIDSPKQVRFGLANGTADPQVEVKLIPHRSEFDDETLTNLWFTNHELDDTMKEATRTIIAMNDGILFTDDNPDFTTRGLEYMTPTGFNIASSSQQAVTMVLEEQLRQRRVPDFSGPLDATLLADSIQAMSRHRQRIAHLAAMKDARTVHGQGNFRCQVIQPSEPTDGGRHHHQHHHHYNHHHHNHQQTQPEAQRGTLRASGSMEDIRRRRQISRSSSSRREHRHSAPVQGSDPMVRLSAQQWRNSTA